MLGVGLWHLGHLVPTGEAHSCLCSSPGIAGDMGLVVPQQHGQGTPETPAGKVVACESPGGEGVVVGCEGVP